MAKQINERLNTTELEQELETAIKAQRQAAGLQRKLESELDKLDVTDRHYERKYESLSRRLEDAFDASEEAEKKISDCEARIESVKKKKLTQDSVYESLKMFDRLFETMSDFEKKNYVRTFIESIELYPNKKGKNGCPIKMVHFRFPVSYNGESVYSISPLSSTTDETVCLLTHS